MMYRINKLKPDRSVTGLIPALTSLFIAALVGIFYGRAAAYTFIAIVFWLFSLYTLLGLVRTRNTGFVVVFLYQFFAGVLIFTSQVAFPDRRSAIAMVSVACTLFSMIWLIYLVATKKIKWRGREVMELAAAPVDETGNGYTPRPLPAGKTEFTMRQIREFAEFARRNLIAVPYIGDDKVVFVPVMMGREFGFIIGMKHDYTDETWVAFDIDGKVSVNISHRDYMLYKEALSFEQLCESLGNLFIDFIDRYHRNEGIRIIDQMDALGIGVFS